MGCGFSKKTQYSKDADEDEDSDAGGGGTAPQEAAAEAAPRKRGSFTQSIKQFEHENSEGVRHSTGHVHKINHGISTSHYARDEDHEHHRETHIGLQIRS